MLHSSLLLSLALATPIALSATAAVVAPDTTNDDGVGFHVVADDVHVSEEQAGRDVVSGAHDTKLPWGLDRLDQRELPLDGEYNSWNGGASADVYILGTGINSKQAEFGGRVGEGFSAIDDEHGAEDCYGHGTGVASVVGGKTLGVAKKARLHSVRVLDCQGRGSKADFMDGLRYVEEHASARAIALIALDRGLSEREFAKINWLERNGISVVIAAGDGGEDVCDNFPDRGTTALVVGATTKEDRMASFSNYGDCVDIMAPGVGITVAGSRGTNTVQSGGIYAAAHAAGVMALAKTKCPECTPRKLRDLLEAGAVSGDLSEMDGVPNLLLNFQSLIEPPLADEEVPPPPGVFKNDTRYVVPNHGKVTSTIVSDYVGASRVTVAIGMDHACAEHLQLTLVAPDGTATTLKPPSYAFGDDCTVWDGVNHFWHDVPSDSDGEWTLHVRDYFGGASGTLEGWYVEFS